MAVLPPPGLEHLAPFGGAPAQSFLALKENVAPAQLNARLEKQLQTRLLEAAREVLRSQGQIAGERLSRKERRQQFMKRSATKKTKTVPEQCKVSVPSEAWSDTRTAGYPVLLGAMNRLRSLLKEHDVEETTSEEGEDEREPVQQMSRTAAVVRNIPLEYTREDVLELIDKHGFQGSYALLYLPIAFQSKLNHGYLFIHFTTADNFERFREHFNGFSDWKKPSDRICEVVFSEKFNDLDDRIECYRNSAVMHESVEERFKPILFENGRRVPFPEPNKRVKAPRCKRSSP